MAHILATQTAAWGTFVKHAVLHLLELQALTWVGVINFGGHITARTLHSYPRWEWGISVQVENCEAARAFLSVVIYRKGEENGHFWQQIKI